MRNIISFKINKLNLPAAVCFIIFYSATSTQALDTPTITATTKAPNQINLTWPGVSNPGYGYKVEIQSDGDARYSSWTELSWQSTTPQSTTGGDLTYLPYWVTEGHYLDVTDGSGTYSGACASPSPACGSAAQAQIYGLKHNTVYNFRVRTYGKTDGGEPAYSSYSNTAAATTRNPSLIRYVVPGGAGSRNGTSWANAWAKISDANGVSEGTLVLIEGGDYPSDNIIPSYSGTQANRTVFQAYQGQRVNITSRGDPWLACVYLSDKNYITVDGINVMYTTNDETPRYQIDGGATRNALVNIEGVGPPDGVWGIVLIQANYNLLHNYYLHDSGRPGVDDANNINIYGDWTNNIIQLGISIRGGHDCMLIKGASAYNQIKNVLHGGGWGHGLCLNSEGGRIAHHNLAEGMTVYDICTSHPIDYFKNGIQAPSDFNTIRRNVIYNGSGSSTCIGQGIELNREQGGGANNLVYNNTIYNNAGAGFILWVTGSNGHTIANNIFYNNGAPAGEPYLRATFTWCDGITFSARNNFIFQNNNPDFASVQGDCWNNDPQTVAQAESSFPSIMQNNYSDLIVDFIDLAQNDVHLKSSSEVINKGVSVPDPAWGTLSYTGSAPDLGAFEYSEISNPTPLSDDLNDDGTQLQIKEYRLSQNYPNPFNPTTTIKYSIPVNSQQNTVGSKKNQEKESPLPRRGFRSGLSLVNLVVYDILGKEVATLVNEQQRPGIYEVRLDASGMTSGVYYYRLQAGSFVQVKKLILMK